MSIKLRLLVDRRRNKVVFAECQADFVEGLFSFLTLPLGIVVKQLDKQSGLGCMDKLYESVENLDAQYLQTEACKDMLLRPRTNMSQYIEDLLVKWIVLEPTKLFICGLHGWMHSFVSNTKCFCGRFTNMFARDYTSSRDKDGPLVNGEGMSFLILDNLLVLQASAELTLLLLKKHGIEDASMAEDIIVAEIKNTDEFLLLLKTSLHSQTPLTDIFIGQRAGGFEAAKAAMHITLKLLESCLTSSTMADCSFFA